MVEFDLQSVTCVINGQHIKISILEYMQEIMMLDLEIN